MTDRIRISRPVFHGAGYGVLLIILMFMLGACQTGGSFEYKPASAGKVDEVLWVMNDAFWADTIGGTVNHEFQASYGILPQLEPEYFLRKKNFKQFNNDIIKKYRTIVICASREKDVKYGFARQLIEEQDEEYAPLVIMENVWAMPQQVFVITADSREDLHNVIRENAGAIKSAIRTAEDKRIDIMLYDAGLNDEASNLIEAKYGFSMDIPSDYYIARDNEDFTWFRKENVFLSSNIMIYKRVLDADEISKGVNWPEFATSMRNYLGNSYITSAAEDSYMAIEDRYAPVYQGPIDVMDQEGQETQGLWRIVNDFMGGPFRNYAWYDEASSTYYMIDVFVHAPKEGKKKFMRHLDHILSTMAPAD